MNTEQVFAVNVSEALLADFAMLRETPFYQALNDHGGKKTEAEYRFKFSAKTIDKLAQHIACRHYSSLCFELSHLCWALVNTKGEDATFNYFYIAEAVTAKRMQSYFENPQNCQCALASASVEYKPGNLAHIKKAASAELAQVPLQHDERAKSSAHLCIHIHQHEFIIHTSRANILAALMEWLVTILPNVFEQAYSQLAGKGFNAIQGFALFLQKDIYAYLK